MSQLIAPPPTTAPLPQKPTERPRGATRLSKPSKRLLIIAGVCASIALASFFGVRAYSAIAASKRPVVPTVRVQRGDLSMTINALGELRGQNPEFLTAPMTGGNEMHITLLRKSGELVKPGDVIVEFDTTEQAYKLKEAEADLAEAEQHILQAKAQQQAQEEEDRYALLKAQTDIQTAELDVRKNPLLPAIVAKQNDLALSSARERLLELQKNLANRKATNDAAIAIQQAGKAKAEAQAATARQNIEAMTLRAHRAGYVSVEQNASGEFFFYGMTLPPYQTGDAVRPGMAVAQIPDLDHWQVEANIGELDRGHLAIGDPVEVTIIAIPERKFSGHVKEIGGTTGPPWNRRFSCKIALDTSSPKLRPGMSAQLVVTTEQMRGVLWLPAQALFESDGRTFVYVRSGGAFTPRDVKLLRRNESRVVISGLNEGQLVALANPAENSARNPARTGALPSVQK